MLNVARIFALTSIAFAAASTVVIIGAGRFNLLHLGFKFVGVTGGLSFILSAVTGILALLIIFVRVQLGQTKDGNVRVVQISLISSLLLVVIFASTVF